MTFKVSQGHENSAIQYITITYDFLLVFHSDYGMSPYYTVCEILPLVFELQDYMATKDFELSFSSNTIVDTVAQL